MYKSISQCYGLYNYDQQNLSFSLQYVWKKLISDRFYWNFTVVQWWEWARFIHAAVVEPLTCSLPPTHSSNYCRCSDISLQVFCLSFINIPFPHCHYCSSHRHPPSCRVPGSAAASFAPSTESESAPNFINKSCLLQILLAVSSSSTYIVGIELTPLSMHKAEKISNAAISCYLFDITEN